MQPVGDTRHGGRLRMALAAAVSAVVLLAAFGGIAAWHSCHPEPRPAPPRPPAPARTAIPFALSAYQRAAVLVLAVQRGDTQRLEVVELADLAGLAKLGEPLRRQLIHQLASPAEVLELHAVTSGQRLTVAWLQRQPGATAVVSSQLDLGSGETRHHGAASVLPGEPAGGRLRLQRQPSGAVSMLFAQHQSPCSGRNAPCLELAFGEPGASRNPAPRPRLELPDPCAEPIAGFWLSPGLWHYAVCSRQQGAPTITLFSAQRQPAYAQAQTLKLGCAAVGGATLGDQLYLLTDCRDQQDTLFVIRGTEPARERVLRERELRCTRGAAELVLDGERHLLDPDDRGLETLLPRDLAGPSARALWTGETLLVAHSDADSVRVDAHSCSENLLTSRELASLGSSAQPE